MNNHLNEELKKKTNELLKNKREINEKTIEITHELEVIKSENEMLKEQKKSCDELISNLQNKTMEYAKQLSNIEQSEMVKEASYKTELETQTKIGRAHV